MSIRRSTPRKRAIEAVIEALRPGSMVPYDEFRWMCLMRLKSEREANSTRSFRSSFNRSLRSYGKSVCVSHVSPASSAPAGLLARIALFRLPNPSKCLALLESGELAAWIRRRRAFGPNRAQTIQLVEICFGPAEEVSEGEYCDLMVRVPVGRPVVLVSPLCPQQSHIRRFTWWPWRLFVWYSRDSRYDVRYGRWPNPHNAAELRQLSKNRAMTALRQRKRRLPELKIVRNVR